MCLDTVNDKLKEEFPEVRKCYKVVSVCYDELIAPIFSGYICQAGINVCKVPKYFDGTIKREYAHKCVNGKRILCRYTPYFHVFLTKEGAESWRNSAFDRIVPVYIKKKDIHCTGEQNEFSVIVTKKFEIKKKDYERALNGK